MSFRILDSSRLNNMMVSTFGCCRPNRTISQIAIWDIPNRSSDFGYPKSAFRFGRSLYPKSNFVPNRDLVHYPKSQFGISWIAIWCIVPNRNLGYPESRFGALSQIAIWDILSFDSGYPKLRFGIMYQITIWDG